jgi:hypothetical protein
MSKTKFTKQLIEDVCEVISTSNKSMAAIAKEFNVSVSKLRAAIANNVEFRDMYARAKEDQADFLAEEIIEIADDSSQDTLTDADGNELENREWVNRSKLRVDARKWIAAKLKPRKYGERVDITSDGEKLSIPILNIDPLKIATKDNE